MTVQHAVDIRRLDDTELAHVGLASHYWVECAGCSWWAVIAGRDNAEQRGNAHTAAHEAAA